MRILSQNNLSFCNGVKRSLLILDEAIKDFKKVYCLGEIINNKLVVDKYKKSNVIFANDVNQIPHGSTVVIRAHGETIENLNYLKNINCNIIDATCSQVKLIRENILQKEKEGFTIVIIGDQNHPEVKGFASLVEKKSYFNDKDGYDFLKENDQFYIVAQTSYNYDKYLDLVKAIQHRANLLNKIVVLLDSICYTTKERQRSAKEIAMKAEIVFVIGDKISSNSTKLYEIASQHCSETYFISSLKDLNLVQLKKDVKHLGIIVGASTPKELVAEVCKTMTDKFEKEIKEYEKSITEGTKPGKTFRSGQNVEVQVVTATPAGISCSIVGVVSKTDMGFIDSDEVELDKPYNYEEYSLDDKINCVFLEYKNGLAYFSKKQYEKKKIDNQIAEKIIAGSDFKFTFNRLTPNKKCLIGRLGDYTILVPASQISIRMVRNAEKFLKKEMHLRMLPPEGDESKRNKYTIFASQRLVLEEERAASEKAFWEKIRENVVVEGKVKRVGVKDGKAFGVFVSVDNFDCLAHITDLSWTKINDPLEVLKIGEKYDFLVLSFDRENKKVSLGYKQLQKKPHEILAEKYLLGSIVTGLVNNFSANKTSAIISLNDDDFGIVFISEISDKYVESIDKELSIGQEITAKVIGYERYNKVKLSIKQAIEPKIEEPSKKELEVQEKNQKKVENKDYVNSVSTGATIGDLLGAESIKKLKGLN